MTITRVRQPHHPGRQTGWRRDPCAGQRPRYGVWDLYRKYAGSGGIKECQGQAAPGIFSLLSAIISSALFSV